MSSCTDNTCTQCSNKEPPYPSVASRYVRNPLARAALTKMRHDESFGRFNKTLWYTVRLSLMDQADQSKFLQLDADESTEDFLTNAGRKSDAVLTQLWFLAAKAFLSPFMTQTSINGFLGRGSMFVLSKEQFRRILELPVDFEAERMLDLGAGDGATTALLSPFFRHVHVTEVSWPMKRILSSRGFIVEEIDTWHSNGIKYDVICALNLLDRCSNPLTLLRQMREALAPNGYILIALVIPFSPYVESGTDHQPEELLPVKGESFEQEVSNFIHGVLEPEGFEIIRWSRVPYLCEGDLERSFYVLDDLLISARLK